MANVHDELELARAVTMDIEQAESVNLAIAHAFNGVSNLLLSILLELRDAREDADDA